MRSTESLLKQKGETVAFQCHKREKPALNSRVEELCAAASAGQGSDK